MGNELAVVSKPEPRQVQQVQALEYTPERVELLKRTICVGSTDDEFELFLAQCRRTRLDPFNKQIHAVKRWDSKQKREVMSVQIGIDGLRVIADRSGEMDGTEGPYWCGDDGAWKDVWLSRAAPVAAKVLVFRKGIERPFVGIARLDAFAAMKDDGTLLFMWAKMPDHMLAKCAEALALRKAFPNDMSGLYIPEELREESAPRREPVRGQIGQPAKPSFRLPGTLRELFQMVERYEKPLIAQGKCAAGEMGAYVAGELDQEYGDVNDWDAPIAEDRAKDGLRLIKKFADMHKDKIPEAKAEQPAPAATPAGDGEEIPY